MVSSNVAAITAPSNLPTTFTVPTFHQTLAVDDDLTMGESIVNACVSAIENTATSLADSISTLLLQLQQNQVKQASSPTVSPTGASMPLKKNPRPLSQIVLPNVLHL
jgi:hypothetical protein